MTLIEPVPTPANLDDKGPITAARIKKFYDDGTRDIRDVQLQYRENAAFIEGDHWVYRHNTRQEILRLPKDPKKVRVTIPRVGPESRRIMSKLLKRPLVFEVTPDAPDDVTIRGARTAEGVLKDKAREQKWERLRENTAWAAWKGGTSFLTLDWDTSKGRYLGETLSGRSMSQGDICVSGLTVGEVATEPGTRDIERAVFWIKAQALPPREVKALYDLKSMPESNINPALSPVQSRVGRNGAPQQLTLVLTYYERPNPDNKKGSVATVVGDAIVDGPHPWPFPFADRLNLVALKETPVEGQWFGRTIVSDAVPVQTALNAASTSILEHLKQAGNARVQGSIASQELAENWTDEAGEFVFFNDQAWSYLAPPSMPAWWTQLREELKGDMDDILGVHDVSRGVAPPNIESGAGLAILAEQDDTPTGRFAQTMADAWGDLATMILQTYEAKVPPEEQRQATIHVPGYVSGKFSWNGQSFAGQTTARVPYEAVAPINEAARFQRLQFFVASKLITTARQASTYLDLPGMGGDFITSIDPNVTKARRENYQLANGEPCVPAVFDNHAVHIEEHNAFRLSGEYERLDQRTQQLVDLHAQAHSTLAAEEAAQQMLKAQFAPGLAQAAQAGQPPGSAQPFPEAMPPQGVQGAELGGAPQGPTDQQAAADQAQASQLLPQ